MRGSDLARIKRLILLGRYRFTRKAELERLRDGILQTDVLEAIISAPGIKKILRSTSPFRVGCREILYIMKTLTLKRCPNCGSRSTRRVRKSFRAKMNGRLIIVPDVEREICPDCRAGYFNREANIAIDAHCFGKNRQRALDNRTGANIALRRGIRVRESFHSQAAAWREQL